MSSITRQNYHAFKQSLQELWIRLQQQLQSCKHGSPSDGSINQIAWQQLEEDLKLVFRIIVDLGEVIEEQWSVSDKLETFVKNLEQDNTELFEENRKNIQKLEENELQKCEINRIIGQLRKNLDLQHEIQTAKMIQEQIKAQKEHLEQRRELQFELSKVRSEFQVVNSQRQRFQEQLALKNTEIELAQLVINDLRVNKQKQNHLCSTVYREKQDTNSCDSLENQSSSQKKVYRRHSSLLEDMVQSQFLYEPRVPSQFFKSTQTIQQSLEDNYYEVSNIEVKSYIKSNRKKSKAITACIMPQMTNSSTQTEKLQLFFEKCFGIMKNKIVSQRIKR